MFLICFGNTCGFVVVCFFLLYEFVFFGLLRCLTVAKFVRCSFIDVS